MICGDLSSIWFIENEMINLKDSCWLIARMNKMTIIQIWIVINFHLLLTELTVALKAISEIIQKARFRIEFDMAVVFNVSRFYVVWDAAVTVCVQLRFK